MSSRCWDMAVSDGPGKSVMDHVKSVIGHGSQWWPGKSVMDHVKSVMGHGSQWWPGKSVMDQVKSVMGHGRTSFGQKKKKSMMGQLSE